VRRLPAGGDVALVDAAMLVLFACIGLLAHDGSVPPGRLAEDALPLVAGWFAAALALRAYARPGGGRFLAAWAAGIPLGVAARAVLLDRPLDAGEAAFLATSLVFTLLLLTLGRAALALLGRGR
jgi:hypothetical protein